VVALLWVAMAAAMAMMIMRPAEVPAPAETTTVVVQPGDRLWGVAAGIAPDGDRRVTISQIVELNGLRSAADIHPGDVLVVPRQGAVVTGSTRRSGGGSGPGDLR
jgi:nucleoid-associated protein YgaU